MCFSATASFLVGGALVPAGGYCIWQAAVKKPRYWGLATVPLFFGIQQLCEGAVWLGLNHNDAALTRSASLAFLLFALAGWPFWFPMQAAIMEQARGRRRILFAVSVISLAWFWILYYPLLTGPESLLSTIVAHHSIQYEFPQLEIYRYIDKTPLRILYFASVALPFAISTEKLGHWLGIVLGLTAIVAAVVFHYAFVSVWCFFAAVFAGYCCWMFYRMPAAGPGGTP